LAAGATVHESSGEGRVSELLWHNQVVAQAASQEGGQPASLSSDFSKTSWAPIVLAVVFGVIVSSAAGTHIVLVGIMVPIVIAIAWSSPRTLLLLLVVWMTSLGLVRRLISSGGSIGFSGDPLLIIGPLIILCLLLVVASGPGAFKNRTTLASVVLAMNVLALVEVVNPGQGTLLTGLGGLLFMLIPVCAFWIGRSMVDDVLMRQILWTVAILGALTAAYGLYQVFHGFPSWDQSWLTSRSYSSLKIQGQAVRSFGTMSSAQEYASYLSVSLMAWLGLILDRQRVRLVIPLAGFAIVGTALFYASVRTALSLGVVGLIVTVLAFRGLRGLTTLIVAPMLIFVVYIGLTTISPSGSGSSGGSGTNSAAGVFANHQLSGLTNPTGKGSSLSGHISATKTGMMRGITRPVGLGVGSVTLAAGRYASNKDLNNNTEYDPGNMGVALGILGLAFYFVLVVLGLRTAYATATRRHDAIGCFALGAVVAMLLQWFNGDLYSVAWIVWLCLGYSDGYLLRGGVDTVGEVLAPTEAPPIALNRRRWITQQ
jgi:hypothetical protein